MFFVLESAHRLRCVRARCYTGSSNVEFGADIKGFAFQPQLGGVVVATAAPGDQLQNDLSV